MVTSLTYVWNFCVLLTHVLAMSVKKKKGGDFKLEGSPSALQDKKLENIGSDHLHVSTRFAKHLPSSTSGLSKSASKSEDSLDSGVYARCWFVKLCVLFYFVFF